MSNITFYSLSDYNNGALIPFTIELDNISEDEFNIEIQENLKRITEEKHDGEVREELIVCDYEDIPEQYVNEWSLSSEFFEYQRLIQDEQLEPEMVQAGLYLGIPIESIQDSYQGQFDNDKDFAYDVADSMGAINENASWPNDCIDWKSAARELMCDFNEHNGYYFSNNY
jgi:antirestriction protein